MEDFVCQRCKKIIIVDKELVLIDISHVNRGSFSKKEQRYSSYSKSSSPSISPPNNNSVDKYRNNLQNKMISGRYRNALQDRAPAQSVPHNQRVYDDEEGSSLIMVGSTTTPLSSSQPVVPTFPLKTTKKNSAGNFLTLTRRGKKDNMATEDLAKENKSKKSLSPETYQVLAHLFQATANVTGMDFPLCTECLDGRLYILQKKIDTLIEENTSYRTFIASTNKEPKQLEENEMSELDLELKEMDSESELLNKSMNELLLKKKKLKLKKQKINQKKKYLENLESKHVQSLAEFQKKHQKFRKEKILTQDLTISTTSKIQLFRKYDILNDSFHIWYSAHFGTINDCRLGSGRLYPDGSFSKILNTQSGKVYELYGSSDFSKLGQNNRLNNGMITLVSCIKEFARHIQETKNSSFSLPYTIQAEKIVSGFKIKYSFKKYKGGIPVTFAANENWCKALKYLLIDLKWLMIAK